MRNQRTKVFSSRELVICLLLVFAIGVVYWQVANYPFVNYDDDRYVSENRQVQGGITKDNIVWAFTTSHANFWHPLTWLSHMFDCQLFGFRSGMHHVSSLVLHCINSVLLLLVFFRMTGNLWCSAFVAALFGLHPLHVESVAWISQRKDVLSTLFWILTMWAYVRYVEAPCLGRYLIALLLFALGLMAKPMLVTLPFVLLLLDYWPLDRTGSESAFANQNTSGGLLSQTRLFWRLGVEKVPLLLLSGIFSCIAFRAQGEAIASLSSIPLLSRLGNAAVSYLTYCIKMFWPHAMAPIYPHPLTGLPTWKVAGSLIFLTVATALVLWTKRRRPYLLVGWLWYLGTLVPVIGLVQVGAHAMADRYTYVPFIGLFLMVSWGVSGFTAKWANQRAVLSISAGIALFALMILTKLQVGHWRDSDSLFKHTLQVTSGNFVAHNNLGGTLVKQGWLDEAIFHYREALRIKPDYKSARNSLGAAFSKKGNVEEAILNYREVLRLDHDNPMTHFNLGVALASQGNLDEAILHLKKAVQLKPDFAEAYGGLGFAVFKQGKMEEAIAYYENSLQIKPNQPLTLVNMGTALMQQGKVREAYTLYSKALQIDPNFTLAKRNREIALRKMGRLPQP